MVLPRPDYTSTGYAKLSDLGVIADSIPTEVNLDSINAELLDHENRIQQLETNDSTQDGRLDALEAIDAGTRLTSVENTITVLGTPTDLGDILSRLTSLESGGTQMTIEPFHLKGGILPVDTSSVSYTLKTGADTNYKVDLPSSVVVGGDVQGTNPVMHDIGVIYPRNTRPIVIGNKVLYALVDVNNVTIYVINASNPFQPLAKTTITNTPSAITKFDVVSAGDSMVIMYVYSLAPTVLNFFAYNWDTGVGATTTLPTIGSYLLYAFGSRPGVSIDGGFVTRSNTDVTFHRITSISPAITFATTISIDSSIGFNVDVFNMVTNPNDGKKSVFYKDTTLAIKYDNAGDFDGVINGALAHWYNPDEDKDYYIDSAGDVFAGRFHTTMTNIGVNFPTSTTAVRGVFDTYLVYNKFSTSNGVHTVNMQKIEDTGKVGGEIVLLVEDYQNANQTLRGVVLDNGPFSTRSGQGDLMQDLQISYR